MTDVSTDSPRSAAKGPDMVNMQVWRGDANGGDFRLYEVEYREGEVVLDVIHRIQATQANDLGVRWNCKAGKCGSCSAEINGLPRLMCMTRMSTFEPGQDITVAPMKTFPVMKDLVTDVSFNYEMAKRIPAFQPKPPDADGKRRMAHRDVERSQEFRKCIECFMCQNVCHVIRDHDDNKVLRRAPVPDACRRVGDAPLDTADRIPLVRGELGLPTATSPSAAPRSAPSTSTSPTTP